MNWAEWFLIACGTAIVGTVSLAVVIYALVDVVWKWVFLFYRAWSGRAKVLQKQHDHRVSELLSTNERLKAIVDDIPKTADGEPIILNTRYYLRDHIKAGVGCPTLHVNRLSHYGAGQVSVKGVTTGYDSGAPEHMTVQPSDLCANHPHCRDDDTESAA